VGCGFKGATLLRSGSRAKGSFAGPPVLGVAVLVGNGFESFQSAMGKPPKWMKSWKVRA